MVQKSEGQVMVVAERKGRGRPGWWQSGAVGHGSDRTEGQMQVRVDKTDESPEFRSTSLLFVSCTVNNSTARLGAGWNGDMLVK